MSVERHYTTQPGAPLVELHNVSRRFLRQRDRRRSFQETFIQFFRRRRSPADEFWPLQDISFSLLPGDCLGVIGPNGSGKSTLLKLITGILEPTGGSMTVRGRLSSLLELGAGFQPDLTGRENIYLNGSIYGLSRRQIDTRIDAIIDYAELGDFIDTPVKHFSSGMYVRLGFAVAIHTEPDLLLVDEVLAVGDMAFQRKCLKSIHDFRYQGGTLLLVSHSLDAIQSVCNRAIWMDEGMIQAEGATTDVILQYQRHVAVLEDGKRAAVSLPPSGVGQRWGSGNVQITQVDLLGATGVPQSVFFTGQEMNIRLRYQSEAYVEAPTFGLAIYHDSGVNLFGPNTELGKLSIAGIEGQGAVVYTIPQLPLLDGNYTISVAVVNHNDTETYDFQDRAYSFQVYPSSRRDGYGIVTLQGKWSFHPQESVTVISPQPQVSRTT